MILDTFSLRIASRPIHVKDVQHRLLMHTPVDRTYAGAWLYTYSWITFDKNKPSTQMAHVACESTLHARLVVWSTLCPCPGNWDAIGNTVVYYAWAAHVFSAVIRCRHCSCDNSH